MPQREGTPGIVRKLGSIVGTYEPCLVTSVNSNHPTTVLRMGRTVIMRPNAWRRPSLGMLESP